MSLSSDLSEYYRRLESAYGAAYFHRPEILSNLTATPDFQSHIAAFGGLAPEKQLLVLLRSLASQKNDLSPRLVDAELVVTFPSPDGITARHTLQVVRQMITSAKTEILVAGFAITEAGGVMGQLADAACRGVRILLLCSDWRSKIDQTAAEMIRETWPTGAPRPQVYEYRNEETNTAGMHIKSLLVDGADMLIGSANFTFPGLNTNFEMGVRLNGHVAQSARAVFDESLRTGRFVKLKWLET
jgi:phosphatidylserine/phosphatidylglycerophosphate/cardiolipin synthase-like enzyme